MLGWIGLAVARDRADVRPPRVALAGAAAPSAARRFGTAFRTTVIGFAAIFLLPARIGEVLRPYLLARHEGLNAAATFATVIVERLLDLVTVLLLFGLRDSVRRASTSGAKIRTAGWSRPSRRSRRSSCCSSWPAIPSGWAGGPTG